MIFDAQQQVNGSIVQSDVCIVGAGAAGITIARELTASRASVCLFESGDLTADRATQALNRGDNGNPYDFPLDESRSRFFGGTTNQWSGWCRPLDPADFERREWIPGSGWPFGIETLLSFYDRARSLCELVARPDVEAARRTLSLDESRIVTRLFELSPPTRFGQVYREDLASAQNVRTYLNANAISFRTDDAGQRIEAIEFRTLSGKSITVSASVFILATGGIENARLLLSSGLNRRHAIGNEYDLVGRFYMDHLAFFSSALEKSVRAPSVDFYTTPFDGRPAAAGPVTAGLTLSDASLRDAGLLGATVRFVLRPSFSIDPAYDSVSVASARRIADSISTLKVPARPLMHFVRAIKGLGNIGRVSTEAAAHMIRPDVQLVIRCLAETAPDRENRVTLSEKHDALGQQRPSVRWQAGDLEKRSISELHNTLADEIARCGIGRVRPINSDFYPSLQTGASHHIGTTRMHDSPRSGVVDRDCRVHGTANLYIAGSSVFPTSGYANPTLTIIALALRLADRLKGVLNR